MAAIDLGFVLAVVAFGWGLSLATYRLFARRFGWPMGAWHREPSRAADRCLACSHPAGHRSSPWRAGYGGHWLSAAAIPVFGVAWAVFWTGFLRVGAQSALLLAPAAGLLLILRWLS